MNEALEHEGILRGAGGTGAVVALTLVQEQVGQEEREIGGRIEDRELRSLDSEVEEAGTTVR